MASQLPGHFKGAAICKGWEEKKKKKGGKIRLKQEEEAETDSETSSSDTETTGRVQERVVASRDNIKDPMVEVAVRPRRFQRETEVVWLADSYHLPSSFSSVASANMQAFLSVPSASQCSSSFFLSLSSL